MKISKLDGFLLNSGLYEEVEIEDESIFNSFIDSSHQLDAYCPKCNKERVFTTKGYHNISSGRIIQPIPDHFKEFELTKTQKLYDKLRKTNGVFLKEFLCPKNHLMIYIFKVDIDELKNHKKFIIEKIGQNPSLMDLNELNIKKYRKILNSEKYKELSKAIGLFSHGIGIGALIYLRRIFEHLIVKANKLAEDIEDDWDSEKYKKIGIERKIKMLKDYLPEYMVKNKEIYSIMSEGIHNLNEEKAKEIFSVVKKGILLILEEEYSSREKKKILDQNSKDLNDLHSRLKNE